MAKINLEKISKEQLEQERNPNYKYFDAPELRYKDGRPMRKYNSPKLQAIEMENKQTAVEWLIDQLRQLSHSLEAHLGMGDIRVTQGMLDELEEKAKQMEKETIEISDEEIKKQSKYWNETTNPDMWTFKLAWEAGAKWYREQLKSRQ